MALPWKDVVFVECVGDYRLRLRFSDGADGIVDVADMVPFDGVFAALKDPALFTQVRVDPESGTITWPGGADLSPESLYAAVVGRRNPSAAPSP